MTSDSGTKGMLAVCLGPAGGSDPRPTRPQRHPGLLSQALNVDHMRRSHNAAKIQRAWRCSLARLEAHNRRQLLYHYIFQQQTIAATVIQREARFAVATPDSAPLASSGPAT